MTLGYFISGIAIGLPLYIFFFGLQASEIMPTEKVYIFAKKKLLTDWGEIVSYFGNKTFWSGSDALGCVIALLIVVGMFLAVKRKDCFAITFQICMVITYIIHTTLVQFDIYSSPYVGGVESRYSLFYLPIFRVFIFLLYNLITESLGKNFIYLINVMAVIILLGIVILEVPMIMGN